MALLKRYGSVKRFGARYGTKTRNKFGKIEAEQRKFHKCPYCYKVKVKRVALGIWQCRKCNSKFAAKAYSVQKKIAEEENNQVETPQEAQK